MTTAMKEILDSRHYRCLELVAEGLSNSEIAESMELTYDTVRHYMADIYESFDLHPYKSNTYAMRTKVIALFLKTC